MVENVDAKNKFDNDKSTNDSMHLRMHIDDERIEKETIKRKIQLEVKKRRENEYFFASITVNRKHKIIQYLSELTIILTLFAF